MSGMGVPSLRNRCETGNVGEWKAVRMHNESPVHGIRYWSNVGQRMGRERRSAILIRGIIMARAGQGLGPKEGREGAQRSWPAVSVRSMAADGP